MTTAEFNKAFDATAKEAHTSDAYDYQAEQYKITLTYNGIPFFTQAMTTKPADRSIIYQVALAALRKFAQLPPKK